MCTAMTLRTLSGASCMGRTMDFSYALWPHVYFVPQNYRWETRVTDGLLPNPYSFIGIGQELDGVLGFFDGVNQHGFAAAALYFAGYAQYPTEGSAPISLASYDFLRYILGNCASLEDLCAQINHIRIIGMADPLTHTVAPLHWIATDRSGRSIVLEQTQRGMELFYNPIGVLANSPDFCWHITNLRNYIQTSPHQVEEALWGQIKLTPFGQAGGTVPLPGGYTSPERFVRTSYLKSHIPMPDRPEDAVISFFQIMKNASIPKGAVITARGTDDYTQYTSFIDTDSCAYYFNTYENLQLTKVGFPSYQTPPTTIVDLGEIIQPMSFQSL